MSEESYRFEILHDVVASNDLFPDETHEKIANTLFELIQSSGSAVTIGLEGGWGSGKSTVVNLLKHKLAIQDKEGDRTLFFLFDAWAHDGDPLRRIFLESLILDIDPDGEDKTLNDLQKEISGRKKTVDVTTKKSTSTLGGWLSFSAIFVPVGAAILSAVNYSNLSLFNYKNDPNWPFIAGILLALFPLWVLVFWFFGGERDKKGNRRWDFFVSDSEESYTQDITENGERTSIEFERFFKQIMSHSIGDGKKYKKALIVVDNLDRVDPDQTLAIWSILQTFFQQRNAPCSYGAEAWGSKLWFLVPYDREGLSHVWSKNDSSVVVNTSEYSLDKSAVLAPPKDNPSDVLVLSFLEKCFQIIAEVPEPVMSAWVEYADSTIKKALVGWPAEKLTEVVATYKRFESRLESSPTPRQIQAFVNRVGILGMRWHDAMSAEAIALYALVRKNRSDRQLRMDLLTEGLPDGYEGVAEKYDLKKQLAGMLFGVDRDKGIQLLLKPEIHSALENGDSKALQSLIEEHGEAFWVVWQAIRESSLPNGHVEEYRIAVTKALCEGVCDYKERASADIGRLISEWKNNDDKWDLDTHNYEEALAALLAIARSEEELVELLNWLKTRTEKSILDAVAQSGNDKFRTARLCNISKIINLLSKYKQDIKTIRPSDFDQNKWKSWLYGLKHEKVEIKCVIPAKGTIKNLSESINPTNPDISSIEILISSIPYLAQDQEWELVADNITSFATNTNHAIGVNQIYELMVKMYSFCNENVKKKIKSITENANFNSRAQSEPIDSVPALLALEALIYGKKLLSSNIAQNIKNFWQADYEPEKCKPLITLLNEVGNLDTILELATDSNNKLAIGFIKSKEDESIFSSSLGVRYFDEYRWASEEDINNIISNSIKYGGLSQAKDILIKEPVAYRHCLKLIFQHGNDEGMGIVNEALKNTSAEMWEEALEEDAALFDCIAHQGNHEFKIAVQNLFLKELEVGKLSSHLWGQFSKIYEKLMDKRDVARSIAEKYFHLNTDPLSDIEFEQVSPCISEFMFKINPDNLMSRVDLWLASEKWARIEWLLSAEIEFDGTPKESLVSRVTAMLNDPNVQNQDILLVIAKAFAFRIEKSNESTKNGGD